MDVFSNLQKNQDGGSKKGKSEHIKAVNLNAKSQVAQIIVKELLKGVKMK
jgi:hypothetical protein